MPIEILKVEGVLDLNLLQIGKALPLKDNEGNVLNGMVMVYDKETVTIDFNYPLAGHHLHFSSEVVVVRDASAEELEHTHVH